MKTLWYILCGWVRHVFGAVSCRFNGSCKGILHLQELRDKFMSNLSQVPGDAASAAPAQPPPSAADLLQPDLLNNEYNPGEEYDPNDWQYDK